MWTAPTRKVRPGEPVRRSASRENLMRAAAERANRSGTLADADGPERPDAQVLIVAASALARFAPFALGTCVTTPGTDSQFQNLPAFNSAAVTEGQPFGVMLDPAATGGAGRGVLCGLVPAQVTISDAGHLFAKINSSLALESATSGYARIIWKAGTSGSQWCLLALPASAGGPADGTAAGQVLIWNNTTKVWEAGGPVVVNFRLDNTNHKFQLQFSDAPTTWVDVSDANGGTLDQGVTA